MARDHGLGAIATKKSFTLARALSCGIPSETFSYVHMKVCCFTTFSTNISPNCLLYP